MGKKLALTPDEERFVEEYLIDGIGTAAYVRAFPGGSRKTAGTESCKLLKKPKIQTAIRAGRKGISKRTCATADSVIRGLSNIAFCDVGEAFDLSRNENVPLPLRQIPINIRKAMISVSVKRRRRTIAEVDYEVEEIEYKFANKVAAFDKISRLLGLYKDLPPLEAVLAFLPSELRESIRTALAAALLAEGGASGVESGTDVEEPASDLSLDRSRPGLPVDGHDARSLAGTIPSGSSKTPPDVVLPASGEDDRLSSEDTGALFD